jgi:hypothetical protein
MVIVVVQLLVMVADKEIVYPTVVFGKATAVGVPDSWKAYEDGSAGTVTDCPLTEVFWGVLAPEYPTLLLYQDRDLRDVRPAHGHGPQLSPRQSLWQAQTACRSRCHRIL